MDSEKQTHFDGLLDPTNADKSLVCGSSEFPVNVSNHQEDIDLREESLQAEETTNCSACSNGTSSSFENTVNPDKSLVCGSSKIPVNVSNHQEDIDIIEESLQAEETTNCSACSNGTSSSFENIANPDKSLVCGSSKFPINGFNHQEDIGVIEESLQAEETTNCSNGPSSSSENIANLDKSLVSKSSKFEVQVADHEEDIDLVEELLQPEETTNCSNVTSSSSENIANVVSPWITDMTVHEEVCDLLATYGEKLMQVDKECLQDWNGQEESMATVDEIKEDLSIKEEIEIAEAETRKTPYDDRNHDGLDNDDVNQEGMEIGDKFIPSLEAEDASWTCKEIGIRPLYDIIRTWRWPTIGHDQFNHHPKVPHYWYDPRGWYDVSSVLRSVTLFYMLCMIWTVKIVWSVSMWLKIGFCYTIHKCPYDFNPSKCCLKVEIRNYAQIICLVQDDVETMQRKFEQYVWDKSVNVNEAPITANESDEESTLTTEAPDFKDFSDKQDEEISRDLPIEVSSSDERVVKIMKLMAQELPEDPKLESVGGNIDEESKEQIASKLKDAAFNVVSLASMCKIKRDQALRRRGHEEVYIEQGSDQEIGPTVNEHIFESNLRVNCEEFYDFQQ